ncbi:hypothetical protein IP86_02635 [Rhodopseudomonas sp. AAP120]|nr:hypothetical protein IP86_02635 [Rhodopseudomonas sp. AAP120]
MNRDDLFEQLIDGLEKCLGAARQLELEHAVYLLQMTVLETALRRRHDSRTSNEGEPRTEAPL